MKALTKAERHALNLLIACGGLSDRVLTQGRLYSGMIRKSTMNRLLAKSLVTLEVKFEHCARIGGMVPRNWYFATAAGCIAFGPELAVLP